MKFHLAVLNFFLVQNWVLAIFEIAKNGIWTKNFFREIDLFVFTSFFGLDFFKFSGSLWFWHIYIFVSDQQKTKSWNLTKFFIIIISAVSQMHGLWFPYTRIRSKFKMACQLHSLWFLLSTTKQRFSLSYLWSSL